MRLTALGKLILLILIVGVAVGGWRWWQQRDAAPGAPNGTTASVPETTPAGEKKWPWSGLVERFTGASKGTRGSPGSANDILFVTTAAKKGWVVDQVKRFNDSQGGKYVITTKDMPSREAMHAILEGSVKPVLWSPGSPMWPARLAEVWPQSHPGSALLDMSDPNAYRVFLRTPLVFLTTKEKAAYLRPLLSGPRCWEALRQISMGNKRVPWGRFRFSHADPITSSSGMLTIGLILMEYSERVGQSGNVTAVSKSRPFLNYMAELDHSLIYDDAAIKGTTALTKAFVEDPGRYDLITAYEGTVLSAAASHPNLAVIYPSPTATSEHAVSLLNSAWINPQQREGALEFLKFLGSPESLQAGLKEKFRPASSSGSLSLAGELSQYSAQGFQQTFSTVELPPYSALNDLAYLWKQQIASQHRR